MFGWRDRFRKDSDFSTISGYQLKSVWSLQKEMCPSLRQLNYRFKTQIANYLKSWNAVMKGYINRKTCNRKHLAQDMRGTWTSGCPHDIKTLVIIMSTFDTCFPQCRAFVTRIEWVPSPICPTKATPTSSVFSLEMMVWNIHLNWWGKHVTYGCVGLYL